MSTNTIYISTSTANRFDAFVTALHSLALPRAPCVFRRSVQGLGYGAANSTVAEAVGAARDLYGAGAHIEVAFDAVLSTRRVVPIEVHVSDEPYAGAWSKDDGDLMVRVHDCRSRDAMEELVARACASPHVLSCGESDSWSWPAPAEASTTYHADGHIDRDLALTWLHVHEKHRVRDLAALPLDALRARVQAAASHASVRVMTPHATGIAGWPTGDDTALRADEGALSREHVLAALATPLETLLQALEAAAVPGDGEAGRVTGTPVHGVRPRSIYSVRRLENQGILLAAQPGMVLWPLWAGALFLLGIRQVGLNVPKETP